MIGWKLLREDGTSLREEGRHHYLLPGPDVPGPWDVVPGNGAYLAVTGGLCAGGFGPLVARVESPDDEPDVCGSGVRGVRCRRTVRVLGAWRWADLPPEFVAELSKLGVLVLPPDGEHSVGGDQQAVAATGCPTVYVAAGGYCYTCEHSRPTVHVAKSGWCETYDESSPTVHVAESGRCATYDSSRPTVHVAAGGYCYTHSDSRPTVHVAARGDCYTFGRSRPTVHVAAGGYCYMHDDSRPIAHVAAGGRCGVCDRAQPTIYREASPDDDTVTRRLGELESVLRELDRRCDESCDVG